MYAPRHFRQQDHTEQLALIARYPFVTLTMAGPDGLQTAHVPVIVDTHAGIVRGHLARANPLVRRIDGHTEALLVAQGPNAYISPDWYSAEHQVPTWNYVAVQIRGRPQKLDDDATMAVLDALSAKFEAALAPKAPWRASKLPPQLYAGLRKAIVGFALPIDSIDGNWKLSQNKRADDRQGVIAALESLSGADNLAIAALMRAVL
jgi:transcriptional regulator